MANSGSLGPDEGGGIKVSKNPCALRLTLALGGWRKSYSRFLTKRSSNSQDSGVDRLCQHENSVVICSASNSISSYTSRRFHRYFQQF